MKVTQEISLDLACKNVLKTIIAKQYDQDSRLLKVTILNQGEPIFVDSGSSVYLNVKRPDGQGATYDGTTDTKIEIQPDGTILVPLTSWMLNVPGKVTADISIASGDSKLSTLNFIVLVEPSPNNSNPQGDERQDTLDNLIRRVTDDIADIETKSHADATYAKKTDIADMETKSNASSTYATKAENQALDDAKVNRSGGDVITGDLAIHDGVLSIGESTEEASFITEVWPAYIYIDNSYYVESEGYSSCTEIFPGSVSMQEWNYNELEQHSKDVSVSPYGITINESYNSESEEYSCATDIQSNGIYTPKVEADVLRVGEVSGHLLLPDSPTTPDRSEPITQAYSERPTGNYEETGLDIVDGSITEISKIKGKTATSINVFNLTEAKKDIRINNGEEVTVLENGFLIKGVVSSNPYCFNQHGNSEINGVLELGYKNATILPTFRSGDEINISFDITLIEDPDKLTLDEIFDNYPRVGNIRIELWYKTASGARMFLNARNVKISNTTDKQTKNVSFAKLSRDCTNASVVIHANSLTMKIENIMATINTTLPSFYVPYLSDTLRHAYINSIKSTNADGTEEEIYQLPETLELGEWDSFTPQTGELTRQTNTITFDGSSDENWQIMPGSNPCAYIALGDLGSVIDDVGIANRYELNPNISVSNNTEIGYRVFNSLTGGNARLIVRPSSDYDFSSKEAFIAELRSNPLTISYKLATPIITKIPNVPVCYTAYNGGTETIIQGEVDNSIYGITPTITQTYAIHENPMEAVNKAYVNNGLAKKLDKTGGTVTGSLTVENGTDTTLPALVVRNNDTTYGLTYDATDEAYKLGRGVVDENGDFNFNKGEGLPVALRDDSSSFTDGDVIVWSSEGNKFVDGGVKIVDLVKNSKLAKLEAEGWVTELVVSRADANVFTVDAFYEDTAYDRDTEFIVAIKVNDELIENILNEDASASGDNCYMVDRDLPVGTIIKIYHNPIVSEHIDLSFFIMHNDDEYDGEQPILDIYKCLKRVRGFFSDIDVSCYSLPSYVRNLELNALHALTVTVPSSVRYLMLNPAWVDDGSEYGDYARLNIHLDGLPVEEDGEILVDLEMYPDFKIYVPYHLLEEAKARFPDVASAFDALVPASKVNEVESNKLYKHTLDFDFLDVVNINDFAEDGDEPIRFYASVSFISNKKYLLETEYINSDEDDVAVDCMAQEDDVVILNNDVTRCLGAGMPAGVSIGEEPYRLAVIRELYNDYIVFDLSDGRSFQILLCEDDYDVPSTCSIYDYVTEL